MACTIWYDSHQVAAEFAHSVSQVELDVGLSKPCTDST